MPDIAVDAASHFASIARTGALEGEAEDLRDALRDAVSILRSVQHVERDVFPNEVNAAITKGEKALGGGDA